MCSPGPGCSLTNVSRSRTPRWPPSGSPAVPLASSRAPRPRTRGLNARVQIHGDRGSAVIDDDELTYFHAAHDGETSPDIGAGSPDNQAAVLIAAQARSADSGTAGLKPTSHTAQYQDFLSSVIKDHPPLVTVAEAIRTLAVIRAIYKSADGGRPVRVTGLELAKG